MALNDKRQGEVAEIIRNASTWVDGERQVLLEELATELEGGPAAEEMDVAPKAEPKKTK